MRVREGEPLITEDGVEVEPGQVVWSSHQGNALPVKHYASNRNVGYCYSTWILAAEALKQGLEENVQSAQKGLETAKARLAKHQSRLDGLLAAINKGGDVERRRAET